MSLSISNHFKITKKNDKERKSPINKDLSILNYFTSSKFSNLKNIKNNNTNKPTKIFFTTSKKPENPNLSKIKTNNLKTNLNHKFEVIKVNEDNDSILSSEREKKDKLLLYFKGKKIYIEIFNGQENSSGVFYDILLEYKIIQCKRLNKNIDYIIFKEGHLKTKRYAIMNNIKMVNPLWVDDKINRNIFKDDKEYLIEANIGEIMVQEKLGYNQDNYNVEKNYDHEIEAEFDIEYANMIDKQRENNNKNKNGQNNTKLKSIGREKRKSKRMNRNKNEVTFLSDEYEHEKKIGNNSKNMIIEDFIGDKKAENNLIIIEDDEIKIEEEIKEVPIQEQKQKSGKKNIFKVITDLNYFNNNSINKIKNKNVPKIRSKTPIKTKSLQKRKLRTKSKDYKHKATSKKIMVTKVPSKFDLKKISLMLDKANISPDKKQNINLNKENKNINSNFNLNDKISKDNSDLNSKDDSNKSISPKKSTLGQKINIITYKLEEKEIQCLKTMDKFEYKGDLKKSITDYGTLYSSASVIIIDKEKSKYDYKMYEFFIDKKILVDFASFLFEFITEKINEDIIDAKSTLDILNKISINEETYFLNKKIRYQRRSLLHSYNIVENISDHKKDKGDKISDNNKLFNFVINKDIIGGEKRIINKIIKFYLKANVIKIDMKEKRSQSVGPGIKFKFKTDNMENSKKGSIFIINKDYGNRNKMDIIEKDNDDDKDEKDDDDKDDDDDSKNEEKNEINEVKGDTYLITKDKIIARGLIRKIPNFKGIISYKYVYDSFWAGQLINLNDSNILKKYQF